MSLWTQKIKGQNELLKGLVRRNPKSKSSKMNSSPDSQLRTSVYCKTDDNQSAEAYHALSRVGVINIKHARVA